MSKETNRWLRENIRYGYTDERGPAWWAAKDHMADGSHFDGPVPEEEVRRLLDVRFVFGDVLNAYTDVEHADGCDGECSQDNPGDCTHTRHAVKDPRKKSIISPDDGYVHGYVAQGWKLHGYQQWTADQLAAITDQSAGELGVASVGLLDHRSVAFIQAKLTGTGLEVGGYGFVPFISAATSVNQTLSSTYITGIEGIVCDNTLAAAMSAALTKLKIKHSRNSTGKLQDVRDHLGLVYQAADEFTVAADALQNTSVSKNDFALWLDEMAPVPDGPRDQKYRNAVAKRGRYEHLWTSDAKVAPWKDTAFGVLQLDNTFRTWERGVKGADGGRMERNLLNMVSGTTAREDNAALDKLAKVLDRKLLVAA